MEPLEEEPPEFDELEELLQPEAILRHESQLKDSMALVHEYNASHPMSTSPDIDV